MPPKKDYLNRSDGESIGLVHFTPIRDEWSGQGTQEEDLVRYGQNNTFPSSLHFSVVVEQKQQPSYILIPSHRAVRRMTGGDTYEVLSMVPGS